MNNIQMSSATVRSISNILTRKMHKTLFLIRIRIKTEIALILLVATYILNIKSKNTLKPLPETRKYSFLFV